MPKIHRLSIEGESSQRKSGFGAERASGPSRSTDGFGYELRGIPERSGTPGSKLMTVRVIEWQDTLESVDEPTPLLGGAINCSRVIDMNSGLGSSQVSNNGYMHGSNSGKGTRRARNVSITVDDSI